MRNMVVGVAVAGVLALMAADASIAGVEVWKIALAGVGLSLFVKGSRPGARSARDAEKKADQ